jgi:hypothetical protein
VSSSSETERQIPKAGCNLLKYLAIDLFAHFLVDEKQLLLLLFLLFLLREVLFSLVLQKMVRGIFLF